MRVADGLEQSRPRTVPFAVWPLGLIPFLFELLVYSLVAAWCSVAVAWVLFPVSCVVEKLKHRVAHTQSVFSTVAFELEVLETANGAD